MRANSIYIENYRPFRILEEVRLGPLCTLVGKNDVGKSNILRALQLFFEKRPKIEESDIHDRAGLDDNVIIEITFTTLPEVIELEDGVETTLQNEMLLDSESYLRIRKTYPRGNLTRFNITLIVSDFDNDRFSGLANLKASDLNERCSSMGIEVKISGRGITNKSKRDELRTKARDQGIPLVRQELPLTTKDDLWKKIESLLPEFILFETDTKLGIEETTFQSQFRPIIKTATEQADVIDTRNVFTDAIKNALQIEVNKIYERLKRHTDAFIGLTVRPEFYWDKAASFHILGQDQQGVENSLDRRGSGMRRLLMVAFFQYLAEREHEEGGDFIFAIEEPENCIHPGLQRELITSFYQLVDEGYQIIVTSHSPVFAGASPLGDLALVIREKGVARAIQTPDLDLSQVADELGVEPSDQITGYSACIFVEGPDDIGFWRAVITKFKNEGHVESDFDGKQIGFIICGGETLKHWINLRAMNRLNRHFGVVVDSDRKSSQHTTPGRKLIWQKKCLDEGGLFFILRKREIENYLHPDAISRSGRTLVSYDDYTDMKETFGENVWKVIMDMSCEEILSMDCYEENGVVSHELLKIAKKFLSLPDVV